MRRRIGGDARRRRLLSAVRPPNSPSDVIGAAFWFGSSSSSLAVLSRSDTVRDAVTVFGPSRRCAAASDSSAARSTVFFGGANGEDMFPAISALDSSYVHDVVRRVGTMLRG